MSLIVSQELLEKAQKGHFAVGAFNVCNLETLQGVVEVAGKLQTTVIAQVSESTTRYAGIRNISALVRIIAENSNIALALHLDYAKSIGTIQEAIKTGFTSVMIDASDKRFSKNVKITKEVVALAKPKGIQVEAELDRVEKGDKGIEPDFLTAPEEAKTFVEETGVDSLAVAIGTAHGLYKGQPSLDFERLQRTREKVDRPLVLHGGIGISTPDIKKAIKNGICKVNIATELKIAFLKEVGEMLKSGCQDIREVLTHGKEEMKKVVKNKLGILKKEILSNNRRETQ